MSGPTEAAKNAMNTLAQASTALEEHISNVEKLHGEVHSNLASQSEAAVTLAKRHNAELELELERSRDLVNRVHSSLVTMIDNLATAVESRSEERRVGNEWVSTVRFGVLRCHKQKKQ